MPGRWRFGVFEVDTANAELRRNGVPLKLREQSFRILAYLVERPGELVTREDLRRVLWPTDTYVDFDHSLNTAIMKLREVLGDSADAPIYIETVPRHGYRFVAPVTPVAGSKAAAAANDIAALDARLVEALDARLNAEPETPGIADAPDVSDAPSKLRAPIVGGSLAAIVLLVVGVGWGAWFLVQRGAVPKPDAAGERELLRTVPITSAAGDAVSPEFSRDGREIAYVWDGSDRKGYDVYVQLVGSALPLRLTYEHRGLIGAPAWSPDDREIAFERCDGKHDGIYAVPALGGEERLITTAACYYTLPDPVAWVGDGSELLMVDRCTPNGPFGVVALTLATGEKRCLTHGGRDQQGDIGWGFALSPDGSTIAFGRTTASLCCDVYRVSVHGGPVERVTSGGQTGCTTLSEFGCTGIMWTPDGRSVVFVSNRNSLPALFRANSKGGAEVHETAYPAIGSFTPDGMRFVYSQNSRSDPASIWRADFSSAGGPLVDKSKILASQFPEADAQPSPDGTRIAWMSLRTGAEEIFVSDSAGREQTQVTDLNRYSGSPRWSPDSKWIAFDSYIPNERAQVFVIEPDGRNVHSLISARFDCVVPSWSRDGKFIYYSTNQGGVWQVWKHNLRSGANAKLTRQGGFNPIESVDGKTVYYTRFYEPGLWKVPSGGGPETQVIADRPQVGFWGHFAVTAGGLYFLDNDADPRPTLEFYRFDTRAVSPVLILDEHAARLQPSLSATADGRTVYFTQYDRQSVIKMMEFSR